MFQISQSDSYTWPVKVSFPVDGGRTDTQSFDGVFKRIPASEIKELNKKIKAGEISDIDLAKEVLVGWKGVNDGKEEIAFSEGARDRLLNVALVASGVVEAFLNSLSGAARKN